MTITACAQPTWQGAAVVAKHSISFNGYGLYCDSYDSTDANKSTAGRYDGSKYSGNQGNLVTLDSSFDSVNLGGANIYGTLHTGLGCPVSLMSTGGIGPHGSQVNDVTTARDLGYIRQDADLTFPDTSLPADYPSYWTPAAGVVVTWSNSITASSTNSTAFPNPPPWGGVVTNNSPTFTTVYPDPPPDGLTTNVAYTTITNYPTPPPAGLVTNVVNIVGCPTLPSPIPADVTTNDATTLTTSTNYPSPETYTGSVITNWNGGHLRIQSYTYYLITGYTYNFTLYNYSYPTYFYGIPHYAYLYSLYQTNTVYYTNTYDYVLNSNTKYVANSLSGKSYVTGPNVMLVLPNGLTGAENFTFAQGASVAVFCGGTAAVLNASQYLTPNFYPANFLLCCAPSVTSVALNGNGQFTGVLIAPNATLTISGGGNTAQDFCGALMVNSLQTQGHVGFHYDESLSYHLPMPPSFLQQPSNQPVLAGQPALFAVTAMGASNYQWLVQYAPYNHPPTPIPGATNSFLLLTNTTPPWPPAQNPLAWTPAGYSVVVTNNFGAITSLVAYLTVEFPPTIVDQPVSQSAPPGFTSTLGVRCSVTNVAQVYQWRFNGAAIAGATDPALVLPNMQSNSAGGYDVVIQNPFGSVTSQTATVSLTVTPDFLWGRNGSNVLSGGPYGGSWAHALAADAQGSLVVAGQLTAPSLDLGGTVLSSTAGNNFLCSYNAAGNLQWAQLAGFLPSGAVPHSRVGTDALGNVYWAAHFTGTANFGNVQLTNTGTADLFLARFTPWGGLDWVRQISAYNPQDYSPTFGFATDPAGNVFLSGSYAGSARFGNLLLTNTGGYLAKYDASGNLLWAADAPPAQALALGPSGALYLSASGTLAKYDPQGNPLWSKPFPHASALAVDARENLFATGYGAGTYDGLTLTNVNALPDFFVAECDGSGAMQWLRQVGSTQEQRGLALAVDRCGAVFVSSVSADARPDPTLCFGTFSLTNAYAFVAEYDTAGNALWAKPLLTPQAAAIWGLDALAPGVVGVAGYYHPALTLGNFSFTEDPHSLGSCSVAKLAGLAPPQLDTPAPTSGSPLQLAVGGAPGFRCVLEGSTNLQDWVPLVTNTVPFNFIDGEVARYPSRYYRVSYRP